MLKGSDKGYSYLLAALLLLTWLPVARSLSTQPIAFTAENYLSSVVRDWPSGADYQAADIAECYEASQSGANAAKCWMEWSEDKEIEEIFILFPDGYAANTQNIKVTITHSNSDSYECAPTTNPSGNQSTRMKCNAKGRRIHFQRTDGLNTNLYFCNFYVYAYQRQPASLLTVGWGLDYQSNPTPDNPTLALMLSNELTLVGSTFSSMTGYDNVPFMHLIGTRPFVVVSLEAQKNVKTVSIVCPQITSSFTSDSGETIVPSDCSAIFGVIAVKSDLTTLEPCDSTFSISAAGGDIQCDKDAKQIIIVANQNTNLSLKNVAIYAEYDCHKLKYKLKDVDTGAYANDWGSLAQLSGTVLTLNLMVELDLAASEQIGNWETVREHCANMIRDSSTQSLIVALNDPASASTNHQSYINAKSASISNVYTDLSTKELFFSLSFSSLKTYSLTSIDVDLQLNWLDTNGDPYSEINAAYGQSYTFTVTDSSVPLSLTCTLTNVVSAVTTNFVYNMHQDALVDSAIDVDSKRAFDIDPVFDYSAADSACSFTYELWVDDVRYNDAAISRVTSSVEKLRIEMWVVNKAWVFQQTSFAIKAIVSSTEDYTSDPVSALEVYCHKTQQTIDLATGVTTLQVSQGTSEVINFTILQAPSDTSCWGSPTKTSTFVRSSGVAVDVTKVFDLEASTATITASAGSVLGTGVFHFSVTSVTSDIDTVTAATPFSVTSNIVTIEIEVVAGNDCTVSGPTASVVGPQSFIQNLYNDDLVTQLEGQGSVQVASPFDFSGFGTGCDLVYTLIDHSSDVESVEFTLEPVDVDKPSDFTIYFDYSTLSHGDTVTLVIRIQDGDGNRATTPVNTIQLSFVCNSAQSFALSVSANSYTLEEGDSTTLQITTTGKMPSDDSCWASMDFIDNSPLGVTLLGSTIAPDWDLQVAPNTAASTYSLPVEFQEAETGSMALEFIEVTVIDCATQVLTVSSSGASEELFLQSIYDDAVPASLMPPQSVTFDTPFDYASFSDVCPIVYEVLHLTTPGGTPPVTVSLSAFNSDPSVDFPPDKIRATISQVPSSYHGQSISFQVRALINGGSSQTDSTNTLSVDYLCSQDNQVMEIAQTESSSPDYSFSVGDTLEVPYDVVLRPTDPVCWSAYTYTLGVYSDSLTTLPTVLEAQNKLIFEGVMSRDDIGLHTVILAASNDSSPGSVVAETRLFVTVLASPSDCDPLAQVALVRQDGVLAPLPGSLILQVGHPPLTFSLPTFEVVEESSFGVDLNLCGDVKYDFTVLDATGEPIISQSFAIYSQSSQKVSIKATSIEQAGTYSFVLSATAIQYPLAQETVDLMDLVIEPPEGESEESLAETQQDASQSSPDQTKLESKDQQELVDSSSSSESTDSKSQSNSGQQALPAQFTSDFDASLRFVPTFQVREIPDAPLIGVRTYASFKIDSITSLGLMTLRFNETVIIYDDYTDLTPQDFEVVFLQNSDEEPQELAYELLEVMPTQITVQLSFDQPMLISQGQVSDQVLVKLNKDLFLLPMRFSRVNTIKNEDEEPFFVTTGVLPKMVDSGEQLQTIESLGGSSQKVVAVMIIIPLLVGIALKGVMKKLWAMINTLQLINALSILSLSVPTNVVTVQKESNAIINFQPIDKELLYGLIFGEEESFPESTPIDQSAPIQRRLEADGYDEALSQMVKVPGSGSSEMLEGFELTPDLLIKSMLVLAFSLGLVTLIILLTVASVRLCSKCCPAFVCKLCTRVKNMLMFNSLLRYWLTVFLSFAIGCSLQVQLTTTEQSTVDQIESVLSLTTLAIFIVLTFVLQRHILKNGKRLRSPNFKQSYGTLYTPCETEKGKWPLAFVSIFCMRRLFVALTVAFLAGQPVFQILATVTLCSFVLTWHTLVWPMENTRQNVLYLLNEYFYLGCCFYSLGFSQYNSAPETRFKVGWIYLGLLGVLLLLNVCVMLLDIGQSIRLICKKRALRKRVEQDKKAREALLKQKQLQGLSFGGTLERAARRRKPISDQLQIVSEQSSDEERSCPSSPHGPASQRDKGAQHGTSPLQMIEEESSASQQPPLRLKASLASSLSSQSSVQSSAKSSMESHLSISNQSSSGPSSLVLSHKTVSSNSYSQTSSLQSSFCTLTSCSQCRSGSSCGSSSSMASSSLPSLPSLPSFLNTEKANVIESRSDSLGKDMVARCQQQATLTAKQGIKFLLEDDFLRPIIQSIEQPQSQNQEMTADLIEFDSDAVRFPPQVPPRGRVPPGQSLAAHDSTQLVFVEKA